MSNCSQCANWFVDNTFECIKDLEERLKFQHGVCSLTNEIHWSYGSCKEFKPKEIERKTIDSIRLEDYI